MNDAKLQSKVRKLFALALDKSASDGEASSACSKAIRACRQSNISVGGLGEILRDLQKVDDPKAKASPVDDLVSEAVRRGVDSLFSELAKGMKRR